jgi:hypothetical protein
MKRLVMVVGAAVLFGCGDSGDPGEVPSAAEQDFTEPALAAPTLEDFDGDFEKFRDELSRLKPEIMARQRALLNMRYDLSNRTNPATKLIALFEKKKTQVRKTIEKRKWQIGDDY